MPTCHSDEHGSIAYQQAGCANWHFQANARGLFVLRPGDASQTILDLIQKEEGVFVAPLWLAGGVQHWIGVDATRKHIYSNEGRGAVVQWGSEDADCMQSVLALFVKANLHQPRIMRGGFYQLWVKQKASALTHHV